MPDFSLLHLTDLHISDPEKGREHLRRGFFQEYINGLHEAATKAGVADVSCVVVTGDFVDKGGLTQFAHARQVLDYVVKKFRLTLTNVGVCIGNHDFDRKLDLAGDPENARLAYRNFASAFSNGKPLRQEKYGVLCTLAPGVQGLMIDATLGCQGADCPGKIDFSDEDDLVAVVQQVSDSDLLVIGAHYPVEIFPGSIAPTEEANWHPRHVWSTGVPLRQRIQKARNGRTIWLFGDTHLPDHISIGNIQYVMTGRFGTRTTGAPTTIQARQAKVVTFRDQNAVPRITTFRFEMQGHTDHPSAGDWKFETVEVRTLAESDLPSTGTVSPGAMLSAIPHSNPPTDGTLAGAIPEMKGAIELIDEALGEEILAAIGREALYQFGRFRTASARTSLSWVSIGPLLNSALLCPVVDKMASWLSEKLGTPRGTPLVDTLFLGMDCWGSAIAAQLSVVTGVPNLSISVRGRHKHDSHLDSLSIIDADLKYIRNFSVVVLVSDVVATGESLRYIYDRIRKDVSLDKPARWFAVSVLADRLQGRSPVNDFLEAHGSACTDLRMPLVDELELPTESILPPTLSFLAPIGKPSDRP